MKLIAITVVLLAIAFSFATAGEEEETSDSKEQQQQLNQRPIYGVSMIVKNEEEIIQRLLESLRPFISYYCICDTGSIDMTRETIETWLRNNGLSGEIHQDPWVSFAWNRNRCLERIQQVQGVTHILLPDADFVLNVHNVSQFTRIGPPHDMNDIAYLGNNRHRQPLLIRSGKRCGYIGRTHEYLACVDNDIAYRILMNPNTTTALTRNHREQVEAAAQSGLEATMGTYDEITFVHVADGHRRPFKFKLDADILAEDLDIDPTNKRYWFYYAQSIENGNLGNKKAFRAYKNRVRLGGYPEEVWYSLYRMGVCSMNITDPATIQRAVGHFLEAYNYNPQRREPLYVLMGYYRALGKYRLCKMFGSEALQIPFPQKEYEAYAFSIEMDVYEWKVLDELSICLDFLGENELAVNLIQRLLEHSNRLKQISTLDTKNRERIQRNLDALVKKIKMTE